MWLRDFVDADAADAAKDKSDEELLVLSMRHPSLFSYLLERYEDAFLRKAMEVVHEREAAEDIVQEAFMKIYQYAGSFTKMEGASFKSWGYKILLNTAFTHYQKRKKIRGKTLEIDPEFYESLPDTVSETAEKHELADYLVSVFSRMPDHFSRVLRMYFIDGLSQKEIADKEGTSVGAIKTRMHRAKQEFRDEVETLEENRKL